MNRILLVEDDANLGYILKEYLQMNDLIVEWVKDGEEGIKVFESSKLIFILLKLQDFFFLKMHWPPNFSESELNELIVCSTTTEH